MARGLTICVISRSAASLFLFLLARSAPMGGLQQRPAIPSIIAQLHGSCAPIRPTIFPGTACSEQVARSNFVMMPQRNKEHAWRWKVSSFAANVSTWNDLSMQLARGRFLIKEDLAVRFDRLSSGKAERFIQTALSEWAHARTYLHSAERQRHLRPWSPPVQLAQTPASLALSPPIRPVGFDQNNLLTP